MTPILPIETILAFGWSGACLYAAFHVFRKSGRGRLEVDQLLLILSLLSLGATSWTVLVAYRSEDSNAWLSGFVNIFIAGLLFLASRRALAVRLDRSHAALASGTYRQKSAILMALALAVIYAGYFVLTVQTPALIIPLFIASAILLVLVSTVGHVALALLHAPIGDIDLPADERDREAEHYGVRKSYLVLACGVWVIPAVALLQMPPLIVANTALAFVVVAEIVKCLALAHYYRKGGL